MPEEAYSCIFGCTNRTFSSATYNTWFRFYLQMRGNFSLHLDNQESLCCFAESRSLRIADVICFIVPWQLAFQGEGTMLLLCQSGIITHEHTTEQTRFLEVNYTMKTLQLDHHKIQRIIFNNT